MAKPKLAETESDLLGLAEVALRAPELTLLLVELLALEEASPAPTQVASGLEGASPQVLLGRALAWVARARRSGEHEAALRASQAAERACAALPDQAGAHLLGALALAELGRRGDALAPELGREVDFHLSCAQSLQPWSWVPRLIRYGLPGLDEQRARQLGDELLGLGFVTRRDVLTHGPNAPALRAPLEGLRQVLEGLRLDGAPERIGMSGYGLAAQAPARGLPNLSVFTRLRTARESVFDSVKGPNQSALDGFLQTLSLAQPGADRDGLRARLTAEFHFRRLTQINGDPRLRDLEGAELEATRESLSARRLRLAAEQLATARRLRPTLQPFSELLRRVGPYPWEPAASEEGAQPARRAAFLRSQPGAPSFWQVLLAAWSEAEEGRIMAR
ncbi:MAG TPA: hypothetical protein DEA08_22355, partial [Planctomycetes bacterium]|nr:hypothetical protein [Planctomycetota bacterium]